MSIVAFSPHFFLRSLYPFRAQDSRKSARFHRMSFGWLNLRFSRLRPSPSWVRFMGLSGQGRGVPEGCAPDLKKHRPRLSLGTPRRPHRFALLFPWSFSRLHEGSPGRAVIFARESVSAGGFLTPIGEQA
jgi:hypothetical protein